MSHLGPEQYQSNRHIRKLLTLAGASSSDVFYDLGCGKGQLCVLAVKEFDVKKAVGIEFHKGRARKAEKYVRNLCLDSRVQIRNERLWECDLSEATIAYSGLTESDEDLEELEKRLAPGCRFVTLALPLVGVIPSRSDYPFYLMQTPFKRTKSMSEWITAALFTRATIEDFYRELDSDKEYGYDKVTFKRILKERLSER